MQCHLTGAQVSDLTGADVLLASSPTTVAIADKGYAAQERVVDPLLQQGKQAVTPSRKQCKEKYRYEQTLL